jgi:hypothetical protein
LPQEGAITDERVEQMNLTGQPRLGEFLIVILPVLVKRVGILTLLPRPQFLLALILLVLLSFGVHTWNTPFSY